MAETFDFLVFAQSIRDLAGDAQLQRLGEEMNRIQNLVVGEPSWKFRQQIYAKRLGRLARFMRGEEIAAELTPPEAEVYSALALKRPERPFAVPVEPLATAAAAPPPTSTLRPSQRAAAANAGKKGAERRRNARIKMSTRARVRRENGEGFEVLEPGNVSKGGISFRSAQSYKFEERILVTMHYRAGQPESAGMERVGVVVRITPETSGLVDYGIEFIS